MRNPAAQMIMPSPRTQMTPLTAARRDLELRVLNLRGWSQEEKTALVEAMVPLIRPNVVLDQTVTATARETEANKIRESQISLKKKPNNCARGRTRNAGNAGAVCSDKERRSQRQALALPGGTAAHCLCYLLVGLEVYGAQKLRNNVGTIKAPGICAGWFGDRR